MRPVVVVEGGVEPELVEEEADLVRRSGAADDAVAAKLGDLRREAADRAGRRRDPDDVALTQLGAVDEADVGGQAHVADRAEELLGGAIDVSSRASVPTPPSADSPAVTTT